MKPTGFLKLRGGNPGGDAHQYTSERYKILNPNSPQSVLPKESSPNAHHAITRASASNRIWRRITWALLVHVAQAGLPGDGGREVGLPETGPKAGSGTLAGLVPASRHRSGNPALSWEHFNPKDGAITPAAIWHPAEGNPAGTRADSGTVCGTGGDQCRFPQPD
jgi:hypothetical protein